MQAYSQDLRERVLRALDRGDSPTEIARRFEVGRVWVREAIPATGATLRYLPPYSPDFNPIEKLFAKLKALLRKAAMRTTKTLWKQVGHLLNCFSTNECTNYFASSGYVCT